MSVQVDTLSLTIPGHVVRKNTEDGSTTLVLTAQQAAQAFESLMTVSPLFSDYLTSSSDFSVPAAELDTSGISDSAVSIAKGLTAVKAASSAE